MAYEILRFPQVIEITGLARSTIYAKLADTDDNFPRPIRLGVRSVGFLASEIDDYIAQLIEMSRPEGGSK
jgi:prophage regulatory protein